MRRTQAAESILGGRVHGNDRPGDALALSDHLDEGVGHTLVAVVEDHLPGHGHRIPRLYLIHEPGLAKGRHNENARAVGNGDFHELQVVAGLLQLDLVHSASHGARLPDARRGAGFHRGKIHVRAGEVRQQFAQRANTQLLQGLRPRRTDQTDPIDGPVQRQRSFFPINGHECPLSQLW